MTTYPGSTWIGGFEIGSSGQWFWWGKFNQIKKITATFWTTGQPGNDGGSEACLMYGYAQQMTWDDAPCSNKYMGLCEIRCD